MSANYRDRRNKEEELAWAISLLRKAQAARAFTTLTIKMEHGNIRQIVEERSLKPPSAKSG